MEFRLLACSTKPNYRKREVLTMIFLSFSDKAEGPDELVQTIRGR